MVVLFLMQQLISCTMEKKYMLCVERQEKEHGER